MVNDGHEVISFAIPKGLDPMIGRDESSNDIVLHHTDVSRMHARLINDADGKVRIRDLGSKGGTLVNSKRISGQATLKDDDRILVGPYEFKISIRKWQYQEEEEISPTMTKM